MTPSTRDQIASSAAGSNWACTPPIRPHRAIISDALERPSKLWARRRSRVNRSEPNLFPELPCLAWFNEGGASDAGEEGDHQGVGGSLARL